MFESLDRMPPDALMALIKMFKADDRETKIDLGVGVYRTAEGKTPVFRAMKKAEARLLETQDSKAYVGPEGDAGFVKALMPHIFGADAAVDRIVGVQTPGGTGALRMAAELMKRIGVERILVGQPSWPNHGPVMTSARLEVVSYQHCDLDSQSLTFDSLIAAIDAAQEGDALLLHGCCHNPTGIDLSEEQWANVAQMLSAKKLLPLIDLAYQGLGRGFDEDAAGMRAVLAAVPEALIAYSCDKNFGVYRDRVGALYGMAQNSAEAERLESHFAALARANWSMPPDHGAAATRLVLEDEALTALWLEEVSEMRARLNEVRTALAKHGQIGPVDLSAVADQNGMFSTLKLTPEQVQKMREDHAIYMVNSGRINVAGFTLPQTHIFVDALKAVV